MLVAFPRFDVIRQCGWEFKGISRGGKELDFSPVSQLKRPPEEDDFKAAQIELANLAGNLLSYGPVHTKFI